MDLEIFFECRHPILDKEISFKEIKKTVMNLKANTTVWKRRSQVIPINFNPNKNPETFDRSGICYFWENLLQFFDIVGQGIDEIL